MKQVVTQSEFDKKVEMEAMFLERQNYMKKEKAFEVAQEEVSQKYQVQ